KGTNTYEQPLPYPERNHRPARGPRPAATLHRGPRPQGHRQPYPARPPRRRPPQRTPLSRPIPGITPASGHRTHPNEDPASLTFTARPLVVGARSPRHDPDRG